MISNPDDIALRLNKTKHHLERRDDQTWQNWLILSRSYALIGYRANAAYCLNQALKLGYDPSKEQNVEIQK